MKSATLWGPSVAALALGAGSANADTKYWNTDGVSNTWTATNWGTDAVGPFTTGWTTSPPDDAVFGANSLITYVTTTDIGNITVNPGFNVTLTAAGTLTTAGAVRTFDVGAGGVLDLAGQNLSTAAGTGFIKSGTGILFSSNGNAYVGGFTLNAGTMIVGGVNAMGGGAGNTLTINGGTLAANATRDLTGKFAGGITVGGDFTFGGTTTGVTTGNAVATANLTFTNNVALGAATRTITLGGTGVYTLGGIVSGAAGTGLTVNATAAGTLVLSGANTYTGPTVVNGGTLRLLRATTSTTTGFTVNTGGTLDLNTNGATWALQAIPISLAGGTLSFSASGNQGRYASGGGAVTVSSASTITVRSLGGTSTAPNNSSYFMDGGLKGSADLTLSNFTNGLGLALRNSNSTYSGRMTVNGNASTTAGAGSGLAIDQTTALSSADLVVNGTLELGNAAGMGWAISGTTGQTVQIDGLGGTGVVIANMATAGTNRTLSVGNNGGGDTFSGIIANGANNTLSLIKNGAGTQILSGANTYTGTTTVSVGTLQLGNGGTTGSLAAAGNGLTVNSNLTISRSNDVSQGSGLPTAAITGLGTLTQAGTGTTTLTALNLYSGGTLINAGTLLANTPVAAADSATGIGPVTVAASGTLGGTGQISPAGNIGVIVNGALAPGASGIGTLTIDANNSSAVSILTMSAGSQFKFELGTAGSSITTVGSSDLLVIANSPVDSVAFNNNTIDFLSTGSDGFYKLFDTSLANAGLATDAWSGLVYDTTTGEVSSGLSAANLASGATATFIVGTASNGGNVGDIYVNVVPEPGSALLAMGGLGMLAIRRRRRHTK